MTPTERKKILDWIKINKWAHPNSFMYVTTHELIAFIESLSTEEPEVLQEGDWCIIETTEQAKQLWLIQYPEIAYNNFLFMQSMNSGSMGYMGADIKYSITGQSRKRQLSFDLFYQYARNTFNNPKP